MKIESIAFKEHPCFREHWSGFSRFKPITVIIGRNNTGKSHLLDLVEFICRSDFGQTSWPLQCKGRLSSDLLRATFQRGASSSEIQGDHWVQVGKHFVDQPVSWEIRGSSAVDNVTANRASGKPISSHEAAMLSDALGRRIKPPFAGRRFRRMLADRDVLPEKPSSTLTLESNGVGATNIIRRYITTSSPRHPREVVQEEFLAALNTIFGEDGDFKEIQVRYHDEAVNGPENHWEVYLGQTSKGLVSLSKSGSGLKTVILLLLNLIVIPHIDHRPRSDYVFAIEEPENNLHPALLRRLLRYVHDYAVTHNAAFFLTTHSSVAIDALGSRPNAQLVHVVHDGASAKTLDVTAHRDKLTVLSALGAKPSDLLQANGVIWVEGPSDRIYLNRWIELRSDSKLQEGRDYQCAFYGGALLAQCQFATPEDEVAELANLLRLNPNAIVVCDSDKTSSDTSLKARVIRVRDELLRVPGTDSWVLAAKEVENYLPGTVISASLGKEGLPDPTQFERFFASEITDPGATYVGKWLASRNPDKVSLASNAAPRMSHEAMASRFDWLPSMSRIVSVIEQWRA